MNKHGQELIKDPKQALNRIFEQVHSVKKVPSSDFLEPFNVEFKEWGCKCLYCGSEDAVKDLVLQNLIRISKQNGFSYFGIDKKSCFGIDEKGDYRVRINAFFHDGFIPIQIWHEENEYYVNGNHKFAATGRLSNDPRIRVITTEKYEADQKQKIESLIRKGTKLCCSVCNTNWEIKACSNVMIKEESVKDYIFFDCPSCGIKQIEGPQ